MVKYFSLKYKFLKRYIDNTFWIMGDKILNLGISFLITVLTARYLGPEQFGIYSYILSLISMFAVAGHMGLSGLVVREIVNHPKERGVILGTTFFLKLFGMLLGYGLLLIYALIYEGYNSLEFKLIAVSGLILVFRSVDVLDFWFQSFVQAKFVSISNTMGLLISSLLKLTFIYVGLNLFYFLLANVIQVIVIGIFLFFFYLHKSSLSIKHWTFSLKKSKELLHQGWPIYFGSIFAILNLKIDQVMIKWYLGPEQVGIYAVAAQLSEAWYFIPTAIVASFFPKLISLYKTDYILYQTRLQQIFDALFVISLIVALLVSMTSNYLINIFFGSQYIESANILVVHIWAAVFIFMRALFSKWILIEDAIIFSLITQGLGAVINIFLNIFLIDKYGSIGAAYSTLVSYATSSLIALAFYKKTRPVFIMMLKSMFLHFLFKSSENEKIT